METFASFSQERVEVHLRFEGPEVDDGTMSLEDIVPVLQAFSSAYAELAKTDDPSSTYRVKIAAVRQGSADIVLEIWKTVTGHHDFVAGAGSILIGGAQLILKRMIEVIRIKRHVKNRPYKVDIRGDNNIVVINSQDTSLEASKRTHDAFESGIIDKQLDRLTSPLKVGRIEAAELEALPINGEALSERIFAEERDYFRVEDPVTTTRGRANQIVTLNSLYKSTNNGSLRLTDGRLVPFSYKGEDKSILYSIFGSENGPVNALCEEKLNKLGEVVSLDIFDIRLLQLELFDLPREDTVQDK